VSSCSLSGAKIGETTPAVTPYAAPVTFGASFGQSSISISPAVVLSTTCRTSHSKHVTQFGLCCTSRTKVWGDGIVSAPCSVHLPCPWSAARGCRCLTCWYTDTFRYRLASVTLCNVPKADAHGRRRCCYRFAEDPTLFQGAQSVGSSSAQHEQRVKVNVVLQARK
jgi:hypothetical protein